MIGIVLFIGMLSALLYFFAMELKGVTWSQIWYAIKTVTPMIISVLVSILATIALVVMF